MKSMTRNELDSRKAKAVRFTRDVLDHPDRADELEDESLEEYAESRHIQIANSNGGRKMNVKTRRELLDKIQELEEENEDLQSRLDEISDLSVAENEPDRGEETQRRRRNAAGAGANPRNR